jgi:hypothetical protein
MGIFCGETENFCVKTVFLKKDQVQMQPKFKKNKTWEVECITYKS